MSAELKTKETRTDELVEKIAEELAGRASGKKHTPFQRFFWNVAEAALVCFLVGFVIWMFRWNTSKDVDMGVIADAVAEQCELGELEEGGVNTLKQYFDLDGAEYEGYVVYTSGSLMDVEELLIVKVSDSGQLGTLETAVDERLEEQLTSFEGYGTNQTELLGNAVVTERGDYFFYGVSENIEQWEEVFLSCVK